MRDAAEVNRAGIERSPFVGQFDSVADADARRVLLDRAITAYTQLLDDEATSARAKAELESTRAELQALAR